MKKISVSELLSKRAELLKELKTVEHAIELMKDSASAERIYTRKNIRNTHLCGVQVYWNKDFTEIADISGHEGYICKEDLAKLRLEIGADEDKTWWINS